MRGHEALLVQSTLEDERQTLVDPRGINIAPPRRPRRVVWHVPRQAFRL